MLHESTLTENIDTCIVASFNQAPMHIWGLEAGLCCGEAVTSANTCIMLALPCWWHGTSYIFLLILHNCELNWTDLSFSSRYLRVWTIPVQGDAVEAWLRGSRDVGEVTTCRGGGSLIICWSWHTWSPGWGPATNGSPPPPLYGPNTSPWSSTNWRLSILHSGQVNTVNVRYQVTSCEIVHSQEWFLPPDSAQSWWGYHRTDSSVDFSR